MFNVLKTKIRDLLPISCQVTVKYWYSRFRGVLEPEMVFLGSLVSTNDLVIDVGGNRGIYAYILSRMVSRVEVFEPNPICCRVLCAWASGKPNVHVHSVALSSEPGFANLHIPIDCAGIEHDASASVEKTESYRIREELVQLRTLDSYHFKEVSLIKIDVEGHEFNVIKGASATIASSRPALLIEIEQRHAGRPIKEVFDEVLLLGYQGYYLLHGRLQSLATFDAYIHQSMEQFSIKGGLYINNFLFLNASRIEAGEYIDLIDGRLVK